MPNTIKVPAFNLGEKISISETVGWFSKPKMRPGDLSTFVPHANGSYQYREYPLGNNPFKNAPPEESHGGVVYFDDDINKIDFEALMRVLGVSRGAGARPFYEYAVFVNESSQPEKEGYMTQLRLVSRSGLMFIFESLSSSEYDKFPKQGVDAVEALWSFIEQEKLRYGGTGWNNALSGKFGGDGDDAKESLSFGFMIESDQHEVYRIWSRAWLVTK